MEIGDRVQIVNSHKSEGDCDKGIIKSFWGLNICEVSLDNGEIITIPDIDYQLIKTVI